MNATLKTKFLLHLNQKKQETGEQGFTLIELLVVIIIIGILAAIALPSFLNQAAKARQSEAKSYVGAIVRAQQAHRLDNTKFASAIETLGVGLKTDTKFYEYKVPGEQAFGTYVKAKSKDEALKGYIGVVQLVKKANAPDASAQGVVCEAKNAGTTDPAESWVTGYNQGSTATDDIKCDGNNAIPLG